MKKKQLTKTYVEYENQFLKQLRANVDNPYFFEVLYFYVRRALTVYNFNLREVDGFILNGRFFGYKQEVLISDIFNTTLRSLSLAMSIRAFILNKNYLDNCYDDRLLFYDINSSFISWDTHRAIMECVEDEDFKQLYEIALCYKTNCPLSKEQKALFEKNTVRPEYRNYDKYLRVIAGDPSYDGKSVIKNNEFLYADFESYEVPKEVEFIGDTAFAYCKNLKTLTIRRKVLLGHFPIIECSNLRQIIVPTELVEYYKKELPFYEWIISDKERVFEEKEETAAQLEDKKTIDENNIEHIYVDVPSADSYTEMAVPVSEGQTPIKEEEEENSIDVKTLQMVFDKVASSYKFFWMMAIISLAKEKHHLAISFDDITIRMAAMAWPIVFEDDIDLGHSDIMKSYLEGVIKNTKLIKGATSNVVENYLKQHYTSQGVDKILSPLMKNVPYRFLAPWIKYTRDAEVIEKSCAKSFNGLYAIHSKYIVLNEEWWDYIYANYNDICDFAMRSFISYLKKYNNDMKLVKLMTTGWQLISIQ